MFLALVIVVSLMVIGLSLLIYAAYAAPEGFEDDRGFYLVKPHGFRPTTPVPRALLSAKEMGFFRR